MASSADTRVLLAIGNSAHATRLAAALRGQGWEVLPAADAYQAQATARQSPPTVAVVEKSLPAGGAIRVLHRLRTTLALAVTPTIVLTDSKKDHRELLDAGAQECIDKSASDEALVAAVGRVAGLTLTPLTAPAHAIAAPERIQAVRKTGLLDSPPEPSLDLLTRLAASLLRTSTALLTVVDIDRQFFKSAIGLDEPWKTARQTPLSYSFCQWAVATGETLVVNDAHQHPLVRHNPAVQELGVVAYAGVPVRDPESQAIGSFCVVDSRSHEWSETDLAVLHDLADVARAEILGSGVPQIRASLAACLRLLGRSSSQMSSNDREDLIALATRQLERIAGNAETA